LKDVERGPFSSSERGRRKKGGKEEGGKWSTASGSTNYHQGRGEKRASKGSREGKKRNKKEKASVTTYSAIFSAIKGSPDEGGGKQGEKRIGLFSFTRGERQSLIKHRNQGRMEKGRDGGGAYNRQREGFFISTRREERKNRANQGEHGKPVLGRKGGRRRGVHVRDSSYVESHRRGEVVFSHRPRKRVSSLEKKKSN